MSTKSDFQNVDRYNFISYSQLSFRSLLFAFSGLLYVSFFAGNYFSSYGKSNTAIQGLTLPVSTTEKLVGSLLTTVLLITVTFVIIYIAVDALFVLALKSIYHQIIMEQLKLYHETDKSGFPYIFQFLGAKEFAVLAMASLLLSSTFLLGSIYFNKFSYVKTAFILVVFFLLLTTIPTFISNIWYKDFVLVTDYSQKGQPEEFYFTFFMILVITSLWIATYYRLREKEV
ncbi:hypothetical protein GCM10023231_13830 [Olivibacter ginsenosidimutans]|uniref:ABC transporter permease n=1 Tax=Olivibacter ginsenosidimutans TaxID=1176537 RepID=A0ABP9AW20_9SPHI